MRDLIFHVTDGPHYAPNGHFKARVIRRSDISSFFVVENARGETIIVHENNIRLLWSDNEHDTSADLTKCRS